MHLVAQPVRQSTHIGRQGRLHVHELTQLDQTRIIHLHAMKRPRIGPQRIGQHPRITPIVFRARHRMPIAKSTELFRVHGKHRQALLHQGRDQRTPRRLDPDGHRGQGSTC